MTFLERVEAKRTRDFPQDFVDPATTPEPSPKKPRTLEPPVQGSSSQATTRAAEAAEQRMQDAGTRGGIADPEAFRRRQRDIEQAVKQQTKKNTGRLFGATRAVALREQLRQSAASALHSSEQTHPAPSTQPPPEPPLKKPKTHPPCPPPDQPKPKETPPTKRHRGDRPAPSALPASSASAAVTGPSPAVLPPPAPAASSAAAAAAAPPPTRGLNVDPELDAALVLGYDAIPQAFEDNTFCGLQNLGNTCYANAVLNVLAKLPCCRLWLLQHQQLAQHDAQHPPGCLLCTLAQDIARLTTMPENAPFRPVFVHRRKDWNDGFLFNNTAQQDATEAFLKIFDTCNDIDFLALTRRGIGQHVLQGSREAYTTPLWKTFGTLVHEATHCTRCGKSYASHVYKNIHTIVLPETGTHGIEDLFIAQLGREPLGTTRAPDICQRDPENPQLGGCGAQNKRYKHTTIVTSPPVLALTLLRFTWSERLRRPVKLHTKVNFNAGFPPIQGAGQYDLRAVLQHRGDDHPTSTNSGHYTAYVRASDADWYHCDDAKPPRRCENGIADVLQAQAYMLFYEQR